jgi:hypothetical protein
MERIIYQKPDGSVAIIIPVLDCGLTIEEIAAKDVPTGFPYKIMDTSELPIDRTQRELWTIDPATLTDGVGA